jgi:hypothetical protein
VPRQATFARLTTSRILRVPIAPGDIAPIAADPDTIRDAIKAVGEDTQVTGERRQQRRKWQRP